MHSTLYSLVTLSHARVPRILVRTNRLLNSSGSGLRTPRLRRLAERFLTTDAVTASKRTSKSITASAFVFARRFAKTALPHESGRCDVEVGALAAPDSNTTSSRSVDAPHRVGVRARWREHRAWALRGDAPRTVHHGEVEERGEEVEERVQSAGVHNAIDFRFRCEAVRKDLAEVNVRAWRS